MKTNRPNLLSLAALSILGVTGQHQATAACLCDSDRPLLTITSPISSSPIQGHGIINLQPTAETELALSGEVDDAAISKISWTGPFGSGTATATTNWDGTWHWSVPQVDLGLGQNTIKVTAQDADGNVSIADIHVLYQQPGPLPVSGNAIVDQKIKITGSTASASDRYNIIATLDVPGGGFSLPCDEDVTISASVIDPDTQQELLLFTDKIPAKGALTCSTKYRATTSAPDLTEVSFTPSTNTRVSLYVFADKGTYLPDWRATKDSETFLKDFARIEKTKLTVEFGDGRSWSSWSDGTGAEGVNPSTLKLKPCPNLSESRYTGKVELRCNR
jgi:hypothetical protein